MFVARAVSMMGLVTWVHKRCLVYWNGEVEPSTFGMDVSDHGGDAISGVLFSPLWLPTSLGRERAYICTGPCAAEESAAVCHPSRHPSSGQSSLHISLLHAMMSGLTMQETHGFDMIPPLQPTRANRSLYQTFINNLLARYESRPTTGPVAPRKPGHSRSSSKSSTSSPQGVAQLVPAPHGAYILFLISTLPVIPCNDSLCNYFVQFSCNVPTSGNPSDSLAWEIYEIARGIFGRRVCWWSSARNGAPELRIWEQSYVDDMHRCMMQALETGWVEVEGERKRLSIIERSHEEGEPPPVPPKDDDKKVVHRRQDSGVSVPLVAARGGSEHSGRSSGESTSGSQIAGERNTESAVRQRNKLGDWLLSWRPRTGSGKKDF